MERSGRLLLFVEVFGLDLEGDLPRGAFAQLLSHCPGESSQLRLVSGSQVFASARFCTCFEHLLIF